MTKRYSVSKLKILHVANFAGRGSPLGYCPNSWWISRSLEELGHEVRDIHELDADPNILIGMFEKENYDFLLVEEGRLQGDFQNDGTGKDIILGLFSKVIEGSRKFGTPVVTWLNNIYVMPQRKHHLKLNPVFKADIVFSTDGGHDKEFQEAGVNHFLLRQGIYQKEAYLGKPIYPTKAEIGFIGSIYEHIWPYRRDLVHFLRQTYSSRFQHFGQDSSVRHDDLNNLCATLKIVIGDSVYSPHYWSNRIYEIIGRGGFLITQDVPGLDQEFTPYKHYIPYRHGDFQNLKRCIDYYLIHDEEREKIRLAGFEYCRKHHTYLNRVKKMLKIIEEQGILKKNHEKFSKPTQDKDFWRTRIKEVGIEGGMAVGFTWPIIDEIHRRYINEYIKPTDRILDAACGYGRTAGWWRDKQYVGVDFLEEFIREAKRRHPRKQFLVADLEKLPFKDQEFDWAVLISVRVVIRSDPKGEEKWKRVEKELKRVAKKIMILEYGDSKPTEIEKAFEIL